MNNQNTCFTAIDFETANTARLSICQVGLVRIENGIATEKISLLVQPPNNYYTWHCTNVHGISSKHTQNEPFFPVIWGKIQHFIENQIVVAHNGFAFDFKCLEAVLSHYGLVEPAYTPICTRKIFGGGLSNLCEKYNIQLNHHDALSDALACAELYKIHLKI